MTGILTLLAVETGEENETTEYTCRAKLYNFVASDPSNSSSKKEWKERGLGTLRLNVQLQPSSSTKNGEDGQDEADLEDGGASQTKTRARLVMRADGSHRVILNTPVQKAIQFGDAQGKEPKGQYMHFMGTVDEGGAGKLEVMQLKVSFCG